MLSRLGRGVGVAVMAGVMTFGPMGVQAAEADAAIDISLVATALGGVGLIAPGALAGATAAEAGAVAATTTACVASVICGGVMVAIGVGALAYTFRDTWVPWVKAWASGPVDATGTVAGGTVFPGWEAHLTFATVTPRSDGHIILGWSYVAPGSGWSDTQLFGNITCAGTTYSPRVESQWWSDGIGQVSGLSSHIVMTGQQSGTWDIGRCPNGGALKAMNLQTGTAGTGSTDATSTVFSWSDGTSAAPDTVTTTNKVCQRPDGSTYTDSRSISNATDKIPVGFCLPGDTAVSVGVVVTPAGGSPIVTQALPLTPTLADVAAYPLCAASGCEYQIILDGVPCRVGLAGCSEWYATSQATPSRVKGRYGPYSFPLSSLRWMTHVYDSAAGTKVSTGTATGTATETVPTPIASVAPPPLTDPVPVPSPLPSPSPTPTTTGDCWPTGAAMWNPVDWVMRPVQCALAWAFVPSTAQVTALQAGVRADLDRTGVPAVLTAVTVPVSGRLPGDSAGCEGPGVDFVVPGIEAIPVHPFSACAEPLKSAAVVTHAVSTVMIVVGGGLGLLRLIGAGLGYNVSLRGGGGDSA